MIDFQERYLELIKSLEKAENIHQLEKKMGLSQGTLRTVLKQGGKIPTGETLYKMGLYSQNIDFNWLIRGKGEMYSHIQIAHSNHQSIIHQQGKDGAGAMEEKIQLLEARIKDLEARIKDKEDLIALLKK
jgi:transcriptional regulator with XRE-family HTH domain